LQAASNAPKDVLMSGGGAGGGGGTPNPSTT
jgi:hypothetical protein